MRLLTDALEIWRGLDNRIRLRAGYALIALLVVIMAWSALIAKVADLERKRTARENVLKELLPLKMAYRKARQSASLLTGRMASLRADDSPAKFIEEIGIKGRGLKIVALKGEERNGIVEDVADVRIDGLLANEAINLLYRLEKGSRPMAVKKANLRVRFDDPTRLDLSLIVALLKPAPGTAR
jgi:general secretion pathway protein M